MGTPVVAVPREPSTRACRQTSASRVSLTDVYRERPPTEQRAPTHHPFFDLFCHRRGRRRNHRLLLRSKMKTEPYRNRGFFLKTEPKSTDLAKYETVTTLHFMRLARLTLTLTLALLRNSSHNPNPNPYHETHCTQDTFYSHQHTAAQTT